MRHKLSKMLLWIGFISLVYSSCYPNHPKQNPQQDFVDSLLALYIDSVYTTPLECSLIFKDAQEKVSDSSSFLKLGLFIGFCQHVLGNTDSALNL